MLNPTRRMIALALLAAAIVAAAVALDLPSAAAQSDDERGRIVAQRLADGRTEFGWQPSGAARVLPRARYFPADAQVGRWLNSSPVEVEGEAIGRINARLHADGRIEFAFTPTGRERILTDARYFPAEPRPNRWLRSTEITIGPMLRYVAISAGDYHTCAIDETGAIACWGSDDGLEWNTETKEWEEVYVGQTDAPEGSFTAVSAGWGHTCAIAEIFETAVSNASASGEIECWGWVGDVRSSETLDDVPTGRFTAVAAGRYHSCGLRESGAIECWGRRPSLSWVNDTPPGSFSAVSSSEGHNCGLRESGAIECWAAGGRGVSIYPLGAYGPFSAMSVGNQHTCAIRASSEFGETGAIQCWIGGNEYGQNDAPAGSFTAVSAGWGHTCAIHATSGEIECWGLNNKLVGLNEEDGRSEWVYAGQTDAPAGRFTAVAAGSEHTCAIRDTGAIVCWGDNTRGQTDVPTQ